MENGDFVGVYSLTKPTAEFGASPSGLWQAWKMLDGDYFIQPIDAGQEPCGALLPVTSEHFLRSFVRHEVTAPEPQDTSNCPLPADDPGLLDFWFQQKIDAERTSEDNTVETMPAEAPVQTADQATSTVSSEKPPQETSPEASPAPAEALATATILDTPQQEPVKVAPAAQDTTAQAVAQPTLSTPDTATSALTSMQTAVNTAALAGKIAQKTVRPTAMTLDGPQTGDDMRLQVIENGMRGEFKMLLSQLQHNRQEAVEGIKQLLERETEFSWKQKYMFSEFGLALRREKYLDLALEAHQKALACAPGDEHVLFNLARTEYELGHVDAAKQHLAQALEALPHFEAAQNFLNFLNSH